MERFSRRSRTSFAHVVTAITFTALGLVGCTVDERLIRPDDAGLADAAPPCVEGAIECTESGQAVTCEAGVRVPGEVCAAECVVGVGCAPCTPAARRCDGTLAQVCDPSGSRYRTVRDCAEWESTCAEGVCQDACAAADLAPSYEGCEFFPTTLANEVFEWWPLYGRAQIPPGTFDLRIVVTNTGDEPAEVVLDRRGTRIDGIVVAPNELGTFSIPYASMGRPYTTGGAHRSLIVREHAYRLRSSRPIVVSQFSPFELRGTRGQLSESQDASLLFPTNALGRQYVGVTSDSWTFGLESRVAYVAVVGASLEPVTVRIQPGTVAIAEDVSSTMGRIDVGEERSLVLERGDVALLVPVRSDVCTDDGCFGIVDGDPTGLRLDADGPIAVIGGHSCGLAPGADWNCDHLEEQLLPTTTLGLQYAGTALVRPGADMRNVLRVVAPFEDTEVTIEADGETTTTTLATGAHVDRRIAGAFRVDANRPVLTALFMEMQGTATMPGYVGAPSLTTVPPLAQYREDYAFVAPSSYRSEVAAGSYVAIERDVGTTVELDGEALPTITPWTRMGDRESALVEVRPGAHSLTGDGPFGAVLFGIGDATSYALPAGLDLRPMVF